MDTGTKILTGDANTARNSMIAISFIFSCYIAINYGFAIDLFSMVVSDMKSEIGFSYTTVGTISAFVRCGFLIASLLSIFLIPLIGAGRLVFLSVVVCTLGFWGMAFAHNTWMIGCIMTVIGACAATVYIPMVEIVGRLVDKKYHGRVIGFICGGQSLGVMGASLIVPYVITHHTWRSAWMVVGFTAVAALILSYPVLDKLGVLRSDEPVKKERGSANQGPSPKRILSILTPTSTLVLILYFLSAFSFNPFQTYLSPYFRDELGLSVDTAAMMWSCIAIPGVVSGLVMGYIADRISISFSLVAAYSATIAATLILIFFPTGNLLIVAGLLFGLAFYSIFGLIPAYISKVNSPAVAVQVFAMANITHGIGGISGNFLGGWLKDTAGSFQWLYGLIVVSLVILILLTLFLPGERANTNQG